MRFRQQSRFYAYILITNTEGQSGHVSVGCFNPENNTWTNTSFTAGMGALGQLLNGITLGSLPVPGKNHENPLEDIVKADSIFLFELDEPRYNKLVQAVTFREGCVTRVS